MAPWNSQQYAPRQASASYTRQAPGMENQWRAQTQQSPPSYYNQGDSYAQSMNYGNQGGFYGQQSGNSYNTTGNRGGGAIGGQLPPDAWYPPGSEGGTVPGGPGGGLPGRERPGNGQPGGQRPGAGGQAPPYQAGRYDPQPLTPQTPMFGNPNAPGNLTAPSANANQLNPYMPNYNFGDTAKWSDPKYAQGAGQMSAAQLAWLQQNQSSYQYQTDFNEAARRFDLENQWRQGQDVFSQGLANRQLGLSEYQATEAARQYQAQLAFEQQRNAEQYGLQGRQQQYTEKSGDRSFGLEQEMGRGRLSLDTRGQAYAEESGRARLGLDTRQQAASEQQFGLRLGLDTRQQAASEQQFGQRLGLDTRQQAASEQQFGQRLGLDTRGQAFTEEQGRARLGLDTQQQQLDTQWRAQQAQLQREDMQNQLTQSRYASFGRAQAPAARWVRSW